MTWPSAGPALAGGRRGGLTGRLRRGGTVGSPDGPARPDELAPAFPPSLLVGYLCALALSEWLLTVSVPAAAACFGLLASTVCLALPLLPGDRDPDDRGAALPLVLAAVPVVRLITVAAPTADLAPLARLVVLAAFTLVAVCVAARGSPPQWRLLRPGPHGWAAQATLPLVAAPLALLVYPLAPPAAQLRDTAPALVLGVGLALAVVPEELLFRGLLVPAATGVAGPAGVPLAAAAYAATFIGYGSARMVLAALVVGWVLGWYRQRTGSALGVVGARVLLVLLVYLVVPAFWP
ncbi:MAG TPA: CPBP family intramembrane glutamic endopeptidase [Micromonosporaceae bacterium]|nr:CPBP family intramembrane glutamic endopeptidase [Micromonosporaceae bacterium]